VPRRTRGYGHRVNQPLDPADAIRVRGARAHNLKDVDLEVPRDSLVVFTGLSGSGKSSLAFDTIFAEGQRRYVESLSSYARMFLDQVDRPDVDFIEGLSPAVAIDQRTTGRSPRSTVGTITEVYDYLRLLWARVGTPHCTVCDAVIARQTVQDIADELTRIPEGTRYQLLAPVARGKKGEFVELFADLAARGFARAVVDGETVRLDDPPALRKQLKHDIAVVVDRLVARPELLGRVTDSLETALRLGDGLVMVDIVEGDVESRTFSERLACPNGHRVELTELEPRTFSFNAPFGACPACDGLGTRMSVEPNVLLGDPALTLREGVILPWAQSGNRTRGYFENLLSALADTADFTLDTAWEDITEADRRSILFGKDFEVTVSFRNRFGRQITYSTGYEGVIPWVERKFAEAETDTTRKRYGAYLSEIACPACLGRRLNPAVLAVRVGDRSIADATGMDLTALTAFLDDLELTEVQGDVARSVLREITGRVRFLREVGLSYLSLSRGAATLSGGESQRIRLASQIGSGLTGVLYVLDEPSIGLHPRDNDRLIRTLVELKALGNSLIVVEHDEDTIQAADWIVDVGPGAGETGGQIVYSGTLPGLLVHEGSVTGQYLSGRRTIPVPPERRPVHDTTAIRVEGARANNLQDVTVSFPVGRFVAVTGVSGSGKSTLVNDILYRVLANRLNGAQQLPAAHTRVTGTDDLDKVVHVDQSPIGRTPRSNPATYTGVFDRIRNLFAETEEARVRGYTAARFSFNVKGGRCEACSGDGTVRIEMNFLPDVYVECETCRGARYNRETLQVLYRGKTIADVLDMPIAEAAEFFAPFTLISRFLRALVDVGLGYVRLGQSGTTLSGGESQRVKLATELQRRSRGRNVYVLDEPTTGLHFADVDRLLGVLQGLVENGNTVIVIEHDLDVIKSADWVIDLGPEGGTGGGRIIVEGTPETVAATPSSWTGHHLARVLAATSTG